MNGFKRRSTDALICTNRRLISHRSYPKVTRGQRIPYQHAFLTRQDQIKDQFRGQRFGPGLGHNIMLLKVVRNSPHCLRGVWK